MDSVIINKRALELILLQCGYKYGLLAADEHINSFSSDEYIGIRELLLKDNFCELDFDGKVHINSQIFSRYIYCIMRSSAMMTVKTDSTMVTFFRSPVDVTVLEYESDNIMISSRSFIEFTNLINTIIKSKQGSFSAVIFGDNEPLTYSSYISETDEKELTNIVSCFLSSDLKAYLKQLFKVKKTDE